MQDHYRNYSIRKQNLTISASGDEKIVSAKLRRIETSVNLILLSFKPRFKAARLMTSYFTKLLRPPLTFRQTISFFEFLEIASERPTSEISTDVASMHLATQSDSGRHGNYAS